MSKLTLVDVLALFVIWAGVGVVSWISAQNFKDTSIPVIASLVAGYYLSKWVILRHDYAEDR